MTENQLAQAGSPSTTCRQPNYVHIRFNSEIYGTRETPRFVREPQFISEYCTMYDGNVQLGRMRAKQFYEELLFNHSPSLSFNLDTGFDTYDPREDKPLHTICQWIHLMAPEGGRLKKVVHEADIVCARGVLTKVSTAIYTKNEGFKLKAIHRKGVIFIVMEKTEKEKQRELNATDIEKRMSYWGHKFEQYVTKNDNSKKPDTSTPVTTKEEYNAIFLNDLRTDPYLKSRQDVVRIIYYGEVDCLDKSGNMVELKTNKGNIEPQFYKWPKSLKWYLQSALVNISKIVVGHRTNDGVVESLSLMTTNDMAKRFTWNIPACFQFLSTIFTHIFNNLENEGDACVVEYLVDGDIRKGIKLQRIPSKEFGFIPESFWENFY